ncbi:hypothetical protein COV23_01175 [Candidatus Wolfebacteria bacterium CG10_big_fil_rev_8_21_14_0_10_31_9]|uniref:Uncharacterized protein n=1 Tax=Candidatus Wolfebacteria bacterium CG10_big_fil_rev_8_21_14_0_10_31_9 TaxID=1975070 RepID=A0A2H0REH6_9BACT|nr:MAG: hypothetical protein COV23_01175 [Candidatus Wolfebacteria bacterium CG10_big_fil_rev_8_21_14_0_10_31_9]
MSKLNKILIVAIVILSGALFGIIYWQKVGFENSYYAVYLSTGDIYFGQISNFPRFKLNDVWLLQKDANNTQSPYNLVKFNKAFWGPSDEMSINREDIIWMSELSKESPVLQAIKNPQSATPSQQNLVPVNQSTSTPNN